MPGRSTPSAARDVAPPLLADAGVSLARGDGKVTLAPRGAAGAAPPLDDGALAALAALEPAAEVDVGDGAVVVICEGEAAGSCDAGCAVAALGGRRGNSLALEGSGNACLSGSGVAVTGLIGSGDRGFTSVAVVLGVSVGRLGAGSGGDSRSAGSAVSTGLMSVACGAGAVVAGGGSGCGMLSGAFFSTRGGASASSGLVGSGTVGGGIVTNVRGSSIGGAVVSRNSVAGTIVTEARSVSCGVRAAGGFGRGGSGGGVVGVGGSDGA